MTALPRSLLFVPGDRPERFAKALASGADAICLDLEDAVQSSAKDEARRHVTAFLSAGEALDRVFVRVSPLTTRAGLADLLALADADFGSAGVMLAKVSDPALVAAAAACLAEGRAGRPPILALIEDAEGLRRAHEISRAPQVAGLCLGPIDLATGFGARFDAAAMASLRLQLRAGAAEGAIGALDGPWPDIADEDGLKAAAASAASLGFSGSLCIHPRQVEAINAAYTPAPEAVAAAAELIGAADASSAGAFMHKGKMVDAPVIAAARQILARAR